MGMIYIWNSFDNCNHTLRVKKSRLIDSEYSHPEIGELPLEDVNNNESNDIKNSEPSVSRIKTSEPYVSHIKTSEPSVSRIKTSEPSEREINTSETTDMQIDTSESSNRPDEHQGGNETSHASRQSLPQTPHSVLQVSKLLDHSSSIPLPSLPLQNHLSSPLQSLPPPKKSDIPIPSSSMSNNDPNPYSQSVPSVPSMEQFNNHRLNVLEMNFLQSQRTSLLESKMNRRDCYFDLQLPPIPPVNESGCRDQIKEDNPDNEDEPKVNLLYSTRDHFHN